MSISIHNIYCKHWLKTPELHDLLNECKYQYFSDNIHHFLHIEDSIHYRYLLNNLKYEDIYVKLIEITDQKEHSLTNYKNLINEFDENNLEKIKLIYDERYNKYIINDGLHRISILYWKIYNDGNIPLKYLNIEYGKNIIDNFKNKLMSTTTTSHYNGWNNRTKYGYHSFNIYNINLDGQRNPKKRLDILRKSIDFYNKTIVDFGCNTGGMLFHLYEIKRGYGLDYDSKCIESCNYLNNILKFSYDLNFMICDLNEFNFDKFIGDNKIEHIDIIFLLSLGSWIQNWKKLYQESYLKSDMIILETNNDDEGKKQLDLFKKLNADIILISDNSSDDITLNNLRKTYLIKKT